MIQTMFATLASVCVPLLIAVTASGVLAAPMGPKVKPRTAVDDRIDADQSTALDLLALQVERLPELKTAESWIVANVELRSAATTSHAFEPRANGGLDAVDYFLRVEGTVHVEAVLEGRTRLKEWRYSNERPTTGLFHSGPVSVRQDPMEMLGTRAVVMRLSEADEGRQVRQAYWIPSEWKDQVAPAHAYLRDRQHVFNDHPTDADCRELEAMLSNDNPLVVIAAARSLASGGRASAVFDGAVTRTQGVEQAVVLMLALQHTRNDPGDLQSFANSFAQLVRNATREKIEGIALGTVLASDGIGRREMRWVLLGSTGTGDIRSLRAADRLQPLMVDELVDRYLRSESEPVDPYLERLLAVHVRG